MVRPLGLSKEKRPLSFSFIIPYHDQKTCSKFVETLILVLNISFVEFWFFIQDVLNTLLLLRRPSIIK